MCRHTAATCFLKAESGFGGLVATSVFAERGGLAPFRGPVCSVTASLAPSSLGRARGFKSDAQGWLAFSPRREENPSPTFSSNPCSLPTVRTVHLPLRPCGRHQQWAVATYGISEDDDQLRIYSLWFTCVLVSRGQGSLSPPLRELQPVLARLLVSAFR